MKRNNARQMLNRMRNEMYHLITKMEKHLDDNGLHATAFFNAKQDVVRAALLIANAEQTLETAT